MSDIVQRLSEAVAVAIASREAVITKRRELVIDHPRRRSA